MARTFTSVALVGRYEDARVAEPIQAIARHLRQAGIVVKAQRALAAELDVAEISQSDIGDDVELIVAVGGDGTMLHAAKLTGTTGTPLLGVNRGRLGFLTDVTPAQMLESLDQVLAGEYSEEKRLRLAARIVSRDKEENAGALALNDIVLQRRDTGRMLDCVTHIDERYVNTHMGDGLIVATPTGSTAYALSCGGPILQPQQDAVVLVPICPHTLSDRPLVVPASHKVSVTILDRQDISADVVADGHSIGTLGPDDTLEITGSDDHVSLIHPPGYDYYEILRSKLHWGRDNRIHFNAEAHPK